MDENAAISERGASTSHKVRPFFRGLFHALSASFVIPVCAGILFKESSTFPGPRRGLEGCSDPCEGESSVQHMIPNLIFLLSAFICFTVSALYHCSSWKGKEREQLLFQKIDHISISFLAAGAYVHIAFYALPTGGTLCLLLNWSCAFASIPWILSGKNKTVAHLITSFSIIPFLSTFYQSHVFYDCVQVWVLYIIGLFIYKLQWPNPWPRFIGFHEIFHLLTIFAVIKTTMIHRELIVSSYKPG